MTALSYYRNDDGDMEAVTTMLRWGWVGSEKANEGEAGTYEVVIDDPDMTLNFVGHRRFIIYEDESDDENEVILDGITQAVRIAHGGGDIYNPDGRVWVVEVADLNTLFTYRVMTGSDSQRPDETDIERVLDIAASEEMGYFDDLTFVSSADPTNMDEANVRGQYTGQVLDQAAQESGKNYWIGSVGNHVDGTDIFLWYDHDSSDEYTSPLSLSNDLVDLDMQAVNAGTATTYPLGKDTDLRRDYARQYDGAYGEFQDGAKYIPNDENPYAPEITASGRDIAYPAPEIKTRARMKSRLLRVLRDHATPDEVIKTTITLPARKVSQLRRGMRVAMRATHEPGYELSRYLRVLSAQVNPVGMRYEVAVELQGPGVEIELPGEGTYYIVTQDSGGSFGLDGVNVDGDFTDAGIGISDTARVAGQMLWYFKGSLPGWHFYNWAVGGSHGGSYSYSISSNVNNVLLIGPCPAGTVTLYTVDMGNSSTFQVREYTPTTSIVDGLPTIAGGGFGAVIGSGLPAGTDFSWVAP